MLEVIKRDGRRVPFNWQRISRAVERAGFTGDEATTFVMSLSAPTRIMEVWEIQAWVERELIEQGYLDVAKSYVNYRFQKDLERRRLADSIQTLQSGDKSVVNENANKDSNQFHTQRDLTAGAVAKSIGLGMLPPEIAEAHKNGDLWWHDLDYTPYAPLTNCCLINFPDLFANGFTLGNAQIESPKSIQTATAQTSQIIAQVASSQYGGATFNNIDIVLAPFAQMNYEKHLSDANTYLIPDNTTYAHEKTVKDIYDAMQALEYELNTLYTSNGQTPFVSLGFGLGADIWECEIQKAILQVRLDGLGKDKRTAIFPKLIFALRDGLNLRPEDPQYPIKQLALACASKRIYPDLVSYDKLIELTGDFKYPMGCRSFLQAVPDGSRIIEGRMNLGVVTLNLPRIALEAKNNLESFWELLADRTELMHKALKYKAERTAEAKPENAPILYKNGAFWRRLENSDSVNDLFKNKYATISFGYIGLYETVATFYGSDWENNSEAKEFSLAILSYFKSQTSQWPDYHYSVYGTPAESLTDKFCKADREKFGDIPGITDKEYYTNSFHYDVRKSPTPFEKIDFEAPYPKYASGGFIHYVELPPVGANLKALETIWDYAYDKLGYFGVNTSVDQCFVCGFKGEFDSTEEGYRCPDCGNNDPETADVTRRLCGYLGNPLARPAIHGRQVEIASRAKHV